MAIGSDLISAGASFAAEAVFGRGARSAAKDAAKAQKRLFDLQAQEQAIRNNILAESAKAQDSRLPFALSLPGGSSYGANVQTATAIGPAGVESIGLSPILVWLLVGAGVYLVVVKGRS